MYTGSNSSRVSVHFKCPKCGRERWSWMNNGPSERVEKCNDCQYEEDQKNREREELAAYHAERERTAKRCEECGAKHWDNATLCPDCQKKLIARLNSGG
jgi:hypothetical protein